MQDRQSFTVKFTPAVYYTFLEYVTDEDDLNVAHLCDGAVSVHIKEKQLQSWTRDETQIPTDKAHQLLAED